MAAGIKISQLAGGGSALEGDTIPIARGGNTFKLTVGDIAGSLTAASNSIKGNPTAATAKAIDISLANHSILARTGSNIENILANPNTVLCRLESDSTLAFRSFTGDLIQNNTISNAKLSQMAAYTIKLNNTGNTANASDFAIADNSVLVRSGNFTSLVANNNTILRRLGGTSTLEFGQVTTDLIVNGAINSDKLAAGSVTNNAITDNTISGNKLVANSVNLDRIQQIAGQTVLGNVGTGLGNTAAVKVTPNLLSTGAPSWDADGNVTANGNVTVVKNLQIGSGSFATTINSSSITSIVTRRIECDRINVDRPVETKVVVPIVNNAIEIDLNRGTVFVVENKNVNIDSITTTNNQSIDEVVSFILQIVSGGNTVISWPASFKWTNGFSPFLSPTAGKTDTFGFFSYNSGNTWWAFTLGLNA